MKLSDSTSYAKCRIHVSQNRSRFNLESSCEMSLTRTLLSVLSGLASTSNSTPCFVKPFVLGSNQLKTLRIYTEGYHLAVHRLAFYNARMTRLLSYRSPVLHDSNCSRSPRTWYDVSLLSFLHAKIHFVVILAIDEDCARRYL